jgi:hypothetical protein
VNSGLQEEFSPPIRLWHGLSKRQSTQPSMLSLPNRRSSKGMLGACLPLFFTPFTVISKQCWLESPGVALEQEVEGDLFLQDIGQGFGFRLGSFDSIIRCVQHILRPPLPDCLPTHLPCPAIEAQICRRCCVYLHCMHTVFLCYSGS